MPRPVDEAALLARAIELGVLEVADAIAWAEGRIDEEAHPHWAIAELCTMSRAHVRDVADTLRQLPGEPDAAWLHTELVRLIARRMREAPEHGPRLLAVLWKLSYEGLLPSPRVEQVVFGMECELSLADAEGRKVPDLYREVARRLDAVLGP